MNPKKNGLPGANISTRYFWLQDQGSWMKIETVNLENLIQLA